MSGRRKGAGLGSAGPDIEDLLGVGEAKRRKSRAWAASGVAAPAPERRRGLNPSRFALVCGAFAFAMAAALLRFADMAAQGGAAPEPAVAAGLVNAERAADLAKHADASPIRAPRAPIIDRNDAPLARDLATYELYLDREAFAYPDELREAAEALAAAFPNRFKADALVKDVKKRRTSLLARPLTALEAQRAHDLGVPGLYLTPRYDRYYPAGALAAHAVGFVDVDGAGQAGVEAALDAEMKARPDRPVRLSLDLRIQRAARAALAEKAREMQALSASVVVMSVETGEVLALVSLPDYNPHQLPPAPKSKEEQELSPLFHRAVAGRYELGSVLKVITYATALEKGVANMAEAFQPLPTLTYGGHEIAWDGGPESVSLPAAFARSLNRVAAELALRSGRGAQKEMFEALGLSEASPIELGEAPLGAPENKSAWREVDTAVASYGYGVEMSPLHLAAAVASLVNGGERVRPTLLRGAPGAADQPRRRVVSAETSRRLRELMRLTVTDGTGKRADAPGLAIGGKTGTARKLGPGGYDKGRTRTSFAAIAPYDRPKLVAVVMLDEASVVVDGEAKISASYTAAPAAGAILEAIAPLAGIVSRPDLAAQPQAETWMKRRPAKSEAWSTGSLPAEPYGRAPHPAEDFVRPGEPVIPSRVRMGGIY